MTDIFRYQEASVGLFIGTVGIFDAGLRLEYLKKTLTHSIQRLDTAGSRSHIERLIELGYEHSEHLSRSQSYHLQGSELKIRDGARTIQVSFFDTEVDEILVSTGEQERGDGSLQMPFVRTESVILYPKSSSLIEGIPEQIQSLGGTG